MMARHEPDYKTDLPISNSLDSNAPLLFFDTAHRAFQRALSSTGSIDRFFRIAESSVRFCFAGPTLIPYLTRALAHLSMAPVVHPDLTIFLWDTLSTKVSMPPPPWEADDYRQGGEIRGFSNDRFHTGYQLDSGALSILDLVEGVGIYWCKSPEHIPDYEIAAPLRLMLYPWLRRRGIVPVHAGAVGLSGGGVLLVGKGGSGKSNTALACLQSDLYYASDDFCLVKPKPTPQVYSLYNTGKTQVQDLERLPFLSTMIGNPDHVDQEKALYFVNEHLPQKIITRFPIKAILIPRVMNLPSPQLSRASQAAALAALTPGTTLLLPSVAQDTFRALSEIVRPLPCYYFDLPRDASQIPPVISKLLHESAGTV